MKVCKMVAVFFSALLLFSTPVAHAGFFGGDDIVIHPGDHVFDLKRFMDSVKETAQALEIVKNSLANFENRVLMHVGLDMDYKPINDVTESTELPTGNSTVNPNNGVTPLTNMSSEAMKMLMAGENYVNRITTTLEDANKDAVAFMQRILNNQDRRQAQDIILHAQTDGLLGEQQKENATSTINAMGSIDHAAATGSAYMNNVTVQESEITKSRLDQQKVKAEEVYGYDPYHPTDYDLKNRKSESENLGFMKFGE